MASSPSNPQNNAAGSANQGPQDQRVPALVLTLEYLQRYFDASEVGDPGRKQAQALFASARLLAEEHLGLREDGTRGDDAERGGAAEAAKPADNEDDHPLEASTPALREEMREVLAAGEKGFDLSFEEAKEWRGFLKRLRDRITLRASEPR